MHKLIILDPVDIRCLDAYLFLGLWNDSLVPWKLILTWLSNEDALRFFRPLAFFDFLVGPDFECLVEADDKVSGGVLNHDSLGVWNRLCLTHDAVVVSLPHVNVHRPPLLIIILLQDFRFMFASCACGFGRLIFIDLHFVNFLFFKVHEAYPYSIHE